MTPHIKEEKEELKYLPCPPVRNSANQYSKLSQRGPLVFHLQVVKVKISSVKAERVFANFGGVILGKKPQNLYTSDRNVVVCKYLRSGNVQCDRSDRKIMGLTWKTVRYLYL